MHEPIDAFPGHMFTGLLKCVGDNDWQGMWSVHAQGRGAVRIKPAVLWLGDTTAAS